MNSKSQVGFSIVIAMVLVVFAIALFGFIGWRLYDHNQSNTKTANATTNNTNTPTSNVSTTGTTTTQPTNLNIKELGVKIQLDDSIKDITYTAKTDMDGNKFAYISTTSLTNASKGSCSSDKGGFASITKASGTTQQVFAGRPFKVDNTTVFKFGSDTYVFIGGTQSTCSSDSTVQSLANKQETTFFKDFKTVQLDQ